MPTEFNIPARREVHCEPCEFHKCVSAFYGHDHSWRDYNCTHPDAFESELPMDDPEKEKLRLEIEALTRREGRHIGKTERQPEWCPLRKQVNNQYPDTFKISESGESITCLRCKRTSYNRNDVEQKYCGFCHVFHDDIYPPARAFWIESGPGNKSPTTSG